MRVEQSEATWCLVAKERHQAESFHRPQYLPLALSHKAHISNRSACCVVSMVATGVASNKKHGTRVSFARRGIRFLLFMKLFHTAVAHCIPSRLVWA